MNEPPGKHADMLKLMNDNAEKRRREFREKQESELEKILRETQNKPRASNLLGLVRKRSGGTRKRSSRYRKRRHTKTHQRKRKSHYRRHNPTRKRRKTRR